MGQSITVTVNGTVHTAEVEPRTLLVHFLREQLNLTGTHIGCDTSTCGCCTVHLDGDAVLSCSTLAVQCDGREVRTVEGLQAEDGTLHPIQQAFHENHGLQCGYCTPGMMMAAVGIIASSVASLGPGAACNTRVIRARHACGRWQQQHCVTFLTFAFIACIVWWCRV